MTIVGILSKLSRPTAAIFYSRVSVFNTNSINIHRNFSSNSANTMRFAQFQRKQDERLRLGVLSEDGTSIVDLSGVASVPSDMIQFIKSNLPLSEVGAKLKTLPPEPVDSGIELLPPVTNPEKIVCIGLNYLGHCQEQNKEAPKEPMFFSKYASALTGPTGDVILHSITNVSSPLTGVIARSLNIFCFFLFGKATRLGSRIGRSHWKRGKTREEGKCTGSCVRLQRCPRYFGT